MLLKQKEVLSIMVQPQSPGIRAIYIVEARNRQEMKEIKSLFEDIGSIYEVRQLSEGTIMAFTIQVADDPSVLSEIERVLKSSFSFCILERSFNDTIYSVIQDLCADTDSRLCRIPRCGICGRIEPFPTKVSMLDAEGRSVINVHYCSRCVARETKRNEKQTLVDLLTKDRRDFSEISKVKLVKRGSQRKTERSSVDPLTYRIAS